MQGDACKYRHDEEDDEEEASKEEPQRILARDAAAAAAAAKSKESSKKFREMEEQARRFKEKEDKAKRLAMEERQQLFQERQAQWKEQQEQQLKVQQTHSRVARPPGLGFRPSDWTCPSCRNMCFGSRSECIRCGYEKEDEDGDEDDDDEEGKEERRPGGQKDGENGGGKGPGVSLAEIEFNTGRFVRGDIDANKFHQHLLQAFGSELSSVLAMILENLPPSKAAVLLEVLPPPEEEGWSRANAKGKGSSSLPSTKPPPVAWGIAAIVAGPPPTVAAPAAAAPAPAPVTPAAPGLGNGSKGGWSAADGDLQRAIAESRKLAGLDDPSDSAPPPLIQRSPYPAPAPSPAPSPAPAPAKTAAAAAAAGEPVFDLADDVVPELEYESTFAVVEWLQVYDMAVYRWAGNEHEWTEYALRLRPDVVVFVEAALEHLHEQSGCELSLEKERLDGSEEMFLRVVRGASGSATNDCMDKALVTLSSMLEQYLFY